MRAETNIDFMSVRKPLGFLSVVLVVASVVLLVTRGLNLGLDFTGGTLVEVGRDADITLEDARQALRAEGYGDAVVMHFGSAREMLVRVPPEVAEEAGDLDADEADAEAAAQQQDEVGQRVFELLAAAIDDLELRRVEFVGPQVGDELRDQSGLALLMAMGMMLLYVWFRFTNKFGVATVTALFHDVIIVLGFFALVQMSFDLTVLAALLAIIGYSLNDTIVVADHIREDFRYSRMTEPDDIINQAINKTIARTLVTSFTTLLVLISLYIFGGEMLRGFSAALIAGVIVGTYSSIYVASNVLMLMRVDKEDFRIPEPEELDEMP